MKNTFKYKFILLLLVILTISAPVHAEEVKYEHDKKYAEKMPYIWMTLNYEGAASDMISDASPNGVELLDSEEGVIVKMTGGINDPVSDPYLYFPMSNEKLSDIFCEEAIAVSIVLKTNVAIKIPDTVNQPELYFRTIQDPSYVRVGHSDWAEHFKGDEKWAAGTAGYKATDEWQVLTFDMSKHSYWTSVPDRLRLDLFDSCQDVDYVIKGIAFFTTAENALAWDGDFQRVAFEEEYLKSNEPTAEPTNEPTATPVTTDTPTSTEATTSDGNTKPYTWIYIVVPVVIIAGVLFVVLIKKKKARQ